MKKHNKYIENDSLKGATHLEVSVYYTKGGLSYFPGGTAPRGYYISVWPVTRSDGMVSFELFAGRKQLLFQTERYSARQFEKAMEMASDFEDELISTVISENQAA